MMEVDNNISLIVGDLQGILNQQLRTHTVPLFFVQLCLNDADTVKSSSILIDSFKRCRIYTQMEWLDDNKLRRFD
jgi:hypothetical protein